MIEITIRQRISLIICKQLFTGAEGYKVKSRQVSSTLLYIRCREDHDYEHVKFEFNNIPLYTQLLLW